MAPAELKTIIFREKRSYFLAAICSAVASFMIFYKLFNHNLYLKFAHYLWPSVVLSLLIIGNLVHGYFAFKFYLGIHSKISFEEIKKSKMTFYKSFIVNFFLPYLSLIVLFISLREYTLSSLALILLTMMVLLSYYFDLRPILKIKVVSHTSI